MLRDMHEAERDLGDQAFTWNEVDYPCAPSSLQTGTQIEFGGHIVEIRLSLIYRQDNFAEGDPQPVSGELVTFKSTVYRIATARVTAAAASTELTLIDKDR